MRMAEAYSFKYNADAYAEEMKEQLDTFPADLLDEAVKGIRKGWGTDNFRIPTAHDLEKTVDKELAKRFAIKSKIQVVEMFLKLRGQ